MSHTTFCMADSPLHIWFSVRFICHQNVGLYRILYRNNDPTCSLCLMIGTRCIDGGSNGVVMYALHCYFVLGNRVWSNLVFGVHFLFFSFFIYVVSSFLIPSVVTHWTAHEFMRTEFSSMKRTDTASSIDSCNYDRHKTIQNNTVSNNIRVQKLTSWPHLMYTLCSFTIEFFELLTRTCYSWTLLNCQN